MTKTKNATLNIRIEPKQLKRLHRLARLYKISASELIRKLIEEEDSRAEVTRKIT
jgi:macrodomain Ter protein organizer (MatP/YcbG family)